MPVLISTARLCLWAVKPSDPCPSAEENHVVAAQVCVRAHNNQNAMTKQSLGHITKV